MRGQIVIAVVVLMTLAIPAHAQTSGDITQTDVDTALARRRAAGSSLEALTARFDQAMFDEEILRERIMELSKDVADLEQDLVVRRMKVTELVVSRYMAGGLTGTERVFNARAFTDLPVQDEYLRLLNAADLNVLNGLENAVKFQVRQQDDLDVSLADQESIVEDLTRMAAELSAALVAADTEYSGIAGAFIKQEEERRAQEEAERKARDAEERRRAEVERRAKEAAAAAASSTTTAPTTTTAVATTTTTKAPPDTTTTAPPGATTTTTEAPPDTTTTTRPGVTTTTTDAPPDTTTTTTTPAPPPATGGKTCPVDAASSFSDTWGAARSGGRTHKGVDIFAARNAPLVAVESGRVTRTSNSSLGGISIYLTGSSGSRYYYAHLEFITDGIRGGATVSVGDVLGGVGTTGNAPAWLPMLHFQFAPTGSGWINPYPLAKSLCG